MKQYRVAILGASGAVGQEMMKILAERKFPVGELHLLASARSAGKVVSWQGQDIVVEEATDAAFAGMDIVLGAAENDIAERFAPAIVRSGAVFVDNSSAFRLDPNVPLVVPEINAGDVKLHHGIISNPNCSTIITLTAINALRKLSPIRDMVVSTYQAVSGAGAGGYPTGSSVLSDCVDVIEGCPSFYVSRHEAKHIDNSAAAGRFYLRTGSETVCTGPITVAEAFARAERARSCGKPVFLARIEEE
jgi:aspartate-semialdehyde dehydrogenase